MSFALILAYVYAAGALACAMWMLKEMRIQNQKRDEPSEDYAIVCAVILISTFWLPILVALVFFAFIAIAYDWLSSIRA